MVYSESQQRPYHFSFYTKRPLPGATKCFSNLSLALWVLSILFVDLSPPPPPGCNLCSLRLSYELHELLFKGVHSVRLMLNFVIFGGLPTSCHNALDIQKTSTLNKNTINTAGLKKPVAPDLLCKVHRANQFLLQTWRHHESAQE